MDQTEETPQVQLLRELGVRAKSILDALSQHDLTHVEYTIAHNPGRISLVIAKLFAGDWSSYEPNPKIFSGMGVCPVCGGDLAECQGLHGLARKWADDVQRQARDDSWEHLKRLSDEARAEEE